jgi:phosphoglycerol transferase MdoB-like AlkP superfamily enzyme
MMRTSAECIDVRLPVQPSTVVARLPTFARFLLAVVAVNVAIYAALRLGFWASYREASAGARWRDVAEALYLGLKFDLRLALILALPLALLGWVPRFDPARSRLARAVWVAYFTAAQSAVLLLYFVDFGHYGYLQARLNASLLEHLTPFAVAAQMAWETYPVLPALAGLLLLLLAYAWLLRGAARRALVPAVRPAGKWTTRAAASALAALYALGIWGAWSLYPLRWSAAYFSASDAVAALALNPVLFLADTLPNRGRTYDVLKVREHYAFTASLLGIEEPRAGELGFARYVAPAKKPAAPYNLVVIHMESLAAFQLGCFGNPLHATPYFDAVAAEGILFTNFFVPLGPTARSVFTMITGIPDLNPGRTASRNPLVVSQHTLVNALAGYEKYYFLGGSATWGNIRGLLASNISDLRMFEEGDYAAPYGDTWGVSDLVLFEKAHATFSAARKPFFAFIQTSGNHRPYTIPEDRRGFESAQVDDATLRAHGFDDLAAYNGLRLLDYALGSFLSRARDADYFGRTIFVMYGDHGVASPTPSPWRELGLTHNHVPMVIYAPWMLAQGRRVDFAASLPDLLPTQLGLLGIPYLNTGMGRDLLALGAGAPHFSLIGEHGVLDDEFFLRVLPDKAYLYRYRSATPTEDVRDRYPQEFSALRRLQEALRETSLYLMHHNPPRPHAPDGAKDSRR